MPIDEWIRLATLRPISTDDRAIGSDRNRSMMPFSMSFVIPDATTNAATQYAMRNSQATSELEA